jgi:putative membrane protein
MGGADIIPGVSGGTMALIVGVYEALIGALSHLYAAALAFVRLDTAEARQHVRQVSWQLLIPLGLGIVTALLVGARVIPGLLEQYPMQCRGLFFGLIAGSLAIPWQRIRQRRSSHLALGLGAAVLAFALVGLPPSTIAAPSLLYVFAAAAVAICAMILPGVSGAFLLLVLGIYEATLHAVNSRDLLFVLVFMLGAGTGLGLFSTLLNYLLQHRHDATMAVLVGLMAGSLRALWPWLAEDRSLHLPAEGDPIGSVIVLGVLGFAFVTALAWFGRRSLSSSVAVDA